MNALSIIEKKKKNLELSQVEIKYFIENYNAGKIPDYQMAAFLMAIRLNGMNDQETADLTMSMIETGDTLSYDFEKKVVDKHSTGGVGDKTSLVLVPLLAALGFIVSKMSGRGLGHTGGTLDKLDSIRGFSTELPEEQVYNQIKEIGCVILGQTADLVPADKKMYALRDVTSTVDSIPLIASSIMSKKIALGADIIVLDVKYGSGAFMETIEDARILAQKLCAIGNALGRKTIACLTNMCQPLGKNVGNALEVQEALDTLKGQGNQELLELSIQLAMEYLKIDNPQIDEATARKMVQEVIDNKKAYQKLEELVEAQGGDLESLNNLPTASKSWELKATKSGSVKEITAIEIGRAAMLLGAGRETKEDEIDLSVGIELIKKVGDSVIQDEVLAVVHYNDEKRLEKAQSYLEKAYVLSEEEIKKPKLVEETIY